MDRRLKIPHSAKVERGFRTTPEEYVYDSGLIGFQYRASSYNTSAHTMWLIHISFRTDKDFIAINIITVCIVHYGYRGAA